MNKLEQVFNIVALSTKIIAFEREKCLRGELTQEIRDFISAVNAYEAKFSGVSYLQQQNGHYQSCVWAMKDAKVGPDSCTCVLASMHARAILQKYSAIIHQLR